MPRFAWVVAPGCPHHITHRGNRKDDVFFQDEDREEYFINGDHKWGEQEYRF